MNNISVLVKNQLAHLLFEHYIFTLIGSSHSTHTLRFRSLQRHPESCRIDERLRQPRLMPPAGNVRLQTSFAGQIRYRTQSAVVRENAGIVAPIAAPIDLAIGVVAQLHRQAENVPLDVVFDLRTARMWTEQCSRMCLH